MESWSSIEVAAFIRSLGLGPYEDAFKENDIVGELLVQADHAMLKQLGVESIGHRIGILNAIYSKRSDASPVSASDARSGLSDELLLERMSGEILKLHNELAALRNDLNPIWYLVDEYRGKSTKVSTPSTAYPQDPKKEPTSAIPGSPNEVGSATVGTIRICLDCIFNYENESTNKNFRVSDSDVCSKILAGILKKYNITDSWKSFCLYIRIGGQERRLNYDEKPLALQNKMKDEGSPSFTIKRTNSEVSSPVTTTPTPSTATAVASKRFPSTPAAVGVPPSVADGRIFTATYNYRAARDDELNVVIGDRFKVMKKDRDWFTVKSLEGGSNAVGSMGWVPSGCLREVGSTEEEGTSSMNNRRPAGGGAVGNGLVGGGIQRPPGIPIDMELPVQAVILYDYDGSGTTNALAVKAGVVLTILKKEDSWLYGKLGERKGWVPDAYVSIVSDSPRDAFYKPAAKIASLMDHFNDNLMEDQRTDVKVVQLMSGKSINLSDLWKSVNLALGRWIEMESRQVSVLHGDKAVILDQLSMGLKWVSLIAGKADVIRTSPKRDEIVMYIEKASDACKVVGMGSVDEDRQLELVYSSLSFAIRLL
ncbi:hypothetical protein BDR26DRAFT_850283 [Obelidium mucronatum]|nr:hypothetical protein BDR26DRAFT_850283 [Obelidium mucronatum]